MSDRRETLAGFRTAGDALMNAFQPDAPLRHKAGKGLTTLNLGMPRLLHHAAQMGMNAAGQEYTERRAREQYAKAAEITESPIERSLIAALLTARWHGFDTIPPLVHSSAKDSRELLPLGDIIIVPQMAFIKFRLDFGLVIEKGGKRHIAAIECDGQEFHQDVVKDRFRDFYLNSWDIPVFRCKGGAIFEDALKEADEVVNKICMWHAS